MRGSVTVKWSATSAQARMRTRSGCGMPPSRVSARVGGSPSGQTPSSRARRSSGMWDSRTTSLRWWSNVG